MLRVATIIDVARLARVSTSTVSHVVNGTRRVRVETRGRVLEAISETGYTPDGVARALRRSRTQTIGLVMSDTGDPVFAEMVRGVEHEARSAGYTILLGNSAEDRGRERDSVSALRERRVDGLLLAPVAGSTHDLIEGLQANRTPVVLLDRLAMPSVDQVGVENIEPMKTLVRHLLDRGHRRIALTAGDLAVPTLRERHRGYVEALQEAGIPIDAALVSTGSPMAEDARAAIRSMLVRDPGRPTAVVAASMVLAVATLWAIDDAGLSIPEEVAVVTFDDFPYADLFTPRLTSVAQPAFAIGREAMRLLLRRIEHADAPHRTVRLRATLAHRESCGCAQPEELLEEGHTRVTNSYRPPRAQP
ncbi:MAG: LacI family transcriptional regulator [Chloroflexota bacterium]|nr:LacI family transcriptional regulator [Chloroflexota bacterium]